MSHITISLLQITSIEDLYNAVSQTEGATIQTLESPKEVDMGWGNKVVAKHLIDVGHSRPLAVTEKGEVKYDFWGFSQQHKERAQQLFIKYNLINAAHEAQNEFGTVQLTEPVKNEDGMIEMEIILEA